MEIKKKITIVVVVSTILLALGVFNGNFTVKKEISFIDYPKILQAIESDLSIDKFRDIVTQNKNEIKMLQDPMSEFPSDPIFAAAYYGREDMIMVLIEYDADPELAIQTINKEIGDDNKYTKLIKNIIIREFGGQLSEIPQPIRK